MTKECARFLITATNSKTLLCFNSSFTGYVTLQALNTIEQEPKYILVFWKNIVFKVAVVVTANSHDAIKHFRKSVITSNQSTIHTNHC